MKRLTLALGIAALFFAGTTAYFALELHEERISRAADAHTPAPPATIANGSANSPGTFAESGDSRQSTSDSAVSPTFAYSATTAQGNRSSGPSEEEQKQAAIAQSRKFLAEFSDPAGRARLLEQHKSILRSTSQGLADYLRMDPDQFARFIDHLAQQHLAHRETAARCMLVEHCTYGGIGQDIVDANNLEINSVFGAETFERYQFFQLSGNERQAMTELRGRLPDNARLSDAKAEELVRAWVDESARIREDMERVGYGIGTSNSMVWVAMDKDPDGKRAAAANEFNQRFRERAAGVLTAEQLAIYTKLQDDALEQHRSFEELRQASN
jgi:hypothetical protein